VRRGRGYENLFRTELTLAERWNGTRIGSLTALSFTNCSNAAGA
jgi:hypothetical protein